MALSSRSPTGCSTCPARSGSRTRTHARRRERREMCCRSCRIVICDWCCPLRRAPFERRVELVARTRHLLSRNSQLATPYTVLHKACITVHHTDKGAAPDVQTRHTVLRIRQGRSGHQHTQETSQTLAVAPPPPQPSGARRAHASSFSTTPNSRGRSQCDQSSLQCVPKSEGMVRAAAERAG